MAKQLFALIKWCGGEDNETFTAGIPLDWIRGFDYKDYINHGPYLDKIFAIEWRDGRKKPIGGWHCYDGFVVKISRNNNDII